MHNGFMLKQLGKPCFLFAEPAAGDGASLDFAGPRRCRRSEAHRLSRPCAKA
jgi:hypothetical protein